MAIEKTINPFINGLHVPYIEVVKRASGHNGDYTIDSYEIEAQRYTRVYASKAIREFLYQKLSMWARDMFTAIQYFGNSEERYIIITYEKIKTLYGGTYSLRRYNDTIKELISMSMIDYKDKERDQFWYNPFYFSPGNRLSLFEECKVKVSTRNHIVGEKI